MAKKNSYDTYANTLGCSTTRVDPHDNWAGYFGNYSKYSTVPDQKVPQGKPNAPKQTYMDATPVVVTRSKQSPMPVNNNSYMASQSRIIEQQREWNLAWNKRVAEMEVEEEDPNISLVVKTPTKNTIKKEDIVLEEKAEEVDNVVETPKEKAVVEEPIIEELIDAKPLDDTPVDEEMKEEETEQVNIFGYPHAEVQDSLYGAAQEELSDEEFLANAENAENEDEVCGTEAPAFSESEPFSQTEQDAFAEHLTDEADEVIVTEMTEEFINKVNMLDTPVPEPVVEETPEEEPAEEVKVKSVRVVIDDCEETQDISMDEEDWDNDWEPNKKDEKEDDEPIAEVAPKRGRKPSSTKKPVKKTAKKTKKK